MDLPISINLTPQIGQLIVVSLRFNNQVLSISVSNFAFIIFNLLLCVASILHKYDFPFFLIRSRAFLFNSSLFFSLYSF